MRVILPEVQFVERAGADLAERPETLDGLRLGFLDTWGVQAEDGTVGLYPLMAAYRTRLASRFTLADVVELKKDAISEPIDDVALDDYLRRMDVVINGEGA